MKPEHWRQIDEILGAALEQEQENRSAFLDKVCEGNDELRREVERLLALDEQAEDLMEEPAFEMAAKGIAQQQIHAMVGRQVGSYRTLSVLGTGGMGEVFLAEDTTLGRKIALKFLPDFMQQDPTARQRFLREAKSAAALDHPFICKIYETGEAEEKLFISMEYVRGETLKDKLAKGSLPVKEALQKALEIAEALEAAHKRSIVHRDLKPDNIMLTPDGHVKVMDFGLAKQLVSPEEGDGQEQTITQSLSQKGIGLGTPAYMSPEQLRRKEVDTRSDIFSFGVVLYEMLTGVHPFKRAELVDTVSNILNEDPLPLAHYLGNVPPVLQHTVRKMLSKDLDKRYQLIHDVVTDLGEVMDDISGSARDAKESISASAGQMTAPLGARSWQQMVSVALVALAAGIVVTLVADSVLSPPPAPRPLMRSSWALPSGQQLNSPLHRQVDLSGDGNLVYAANGQLYLRSLDRLVATPIPEIEGAARAPFFSPDGQWVGFEETSAGRNRLRKVSVSGGPPVTLCDSWSLYGASWGADNRIVFGQGPEGIFQVPANGGTKELLISVDSLEEAHQPQVLPGGEAVLFMLLTNPSVGALNRNWGEAQIVVQSLETGERKVLVNGATNARYAPTGHLVYVREGVLLAQGFDPSQLEVLGEPVPIMEGIMQSNASGAAQFSFSDLGSLLYISVRSPQAGRRLVWVDREGSEELLAVQPGPYLFPNVSPDGSRVGITIDDPDNTDTWSYDLGRETMTRLTVNPALDSGSTWTPDGQRVVFTSGRDGQDFDLYWKSADGSGQAERLTTSSKRKAAWSFSPDGKKLVFGEADPETSWDLWVLSMEDEHTVKPLIRTQFNEYGGMLSPDGRWIAYASNESGRIQVYVRPFPDVDKGKTPISREGARHPLWGRDGRELFYLSRGGTAMMVVRVETEPTFTAGIPEVLFTGDFAYGGGRLYDIAPDGQRFLMFKEGDQGQETGSPTQLVVVLNWFEELKRLVPTE